MKKLNLLVIVGLALGAAAVANAKVGVVDVQAAIQGTAAGKKAKEQLDGEFQKRKGQLDKRKADIEKMGQDLEKKRSLLSEDVLGKRQMELQEEMMKFQKSVAENQLDIQKKEKELVEPILGKMRKVIEKIAKEKEFTIILDRGPQGVIFTASGVDITDDVIKAYEKEK